MAPNAKAVVTLCDEAGITRIADLTGLDRIGIPVWQSARPMSRALSVHQGKALTAADAILGALMEGVESHHAENWTPNCKSGGGVHATGLSWSELPSDQRSAAADDFAVRRGGVDPHRPLDWYLVEPLGDTLPFYAPVRAIALDCCVEPGNGVSTDSNGQAAHFSLEAATLSGLLELVERDAVSQWFAKSWGLRSFSLIDLSAIEDLGLLHLLGRIADAGIGVRLFELSSVVRLPVILAALGEGSPDDSPHQFAWGAAARFGAVEAATAALLEAVQGRCTFLAAARDTIPIDYAKQITPPSRNWLAPPGRVSDARTMSAAWREPWDVAKFAWAFSRAGYPQVGRVTLSPPSSPAVTVKTFVPGLGNEERHRRPSG